MLKTTAKFSLLALVPISGASGHGPSVAEQVEVLVLGSQGEIGRAILYEAPNGVLLRVHLEGLSPGWHGAHFHQRADCSNGFAAAGGHILSGSASASAQGHAHGEDPQYGLLNKRANDAGALPNIYVASDGSANVELFSTFLSLTGQEGRPALLDADGAALIIHEGEQDQTGEKDTVGDRVACAAIKGGAGLVKSGVAEQGHGEGK